MLLALNDYNVTGSLYLLCLFIVLSLIMIADYMYRSAFIYNCCVCRWYSYEYVSMFAIGCYLCDVSLATGISLLICIYGNILLNYGYLCFTVCVLITALNPPSYNTIRCSFCVTLLNLPDNTLCSLLVSVSDLQLCIFVQAVLSFKYIYLM